MISAADAAAQYKVPLSRILAAVRLGLLHSQTNPSSGLVGVDEQELQQLIKGAKKDE